MGLYLDFICWLNVFEYIFNINSYRKVLIKVIFIKWESKFWCLSRIFFIVVVLVILLVKYVMCWYVLWIMRVYFVVSDSLMIVIV